MKRLTVVCTVACIILTLTNCNKDDNKPKVDVVPIAVDFTIDSSGIVVNPYGYTPLSAQLSFNSVKSGRTFIRIHGRHGALSDVTHLFSDTGAFHSIPVVGMYADTVNTVDIRIVDVNGDTLAQSSVSITTQALPSNMPASIVTDKLDEAKTESGMYLISNFSTYGVSGEFIPYILDAYGDIRWVLDYSSNTELSNLYYEDGIARLKNGNFYFGNTSNNSIYEVDILGKILNKWAMPGYLFHHEVHEETNGNFILTASKEGSTYTGSTDPTIEDYVIEISRNANQIITVWDLKESLDEHRNVWGVLSASDWFHGNAVFDDSTDNTIVVSGRNQGVVKLDRSNNVKWILAPHEGWNVVNRRGDSLNKYLLTPLDVSGNLIIDTSVVYGHTSAADFEWNYYQHSPIQLPDGNLMVFDNGTNRFLDATDGNIPSNGAPGKYSRAVEFKINEANKTVQQVWQYGKERDVACYSSIVSSVQYLPESNHVVFAPGALVQNNNGKGGKIIELNYDTKEVVNEISITSVNNFSHHRAKKISMYPDNL